MSVEGRIRWQGPRLLASGATVCRLLVSRRGARRWMLAFGLLGAVIVGGGISVGFDASRTTRDAVDAARSENRALRVRQEVLRQRLLDLDVQAVGGAARERIAATLAGTATDSGLPEGEITEGPAEPEDPGMRGGSATAPEAPAASERALVSISGRPR